MSMIAWVAGAATLTYGGVAAGMFLFEERLVFPAPTVPAEHLHRLARARGAEELTITTADGVALYGWRVPGGDRAALIFSGNAATVGGYEDVYAQLGALGFTVYHFNYRGYPGSEGSPTEAGLREDGRAAWRRVRQDFEPDAIAVVGRSLGGGVAVGVAAEACAAGEPPGWLALFATFSAAVEVAAASYPWLPVRLIMRNRFDSTALAGGVTSPTLILHGQADSMIAPSHAATLAAAFPTAPRIHYVDGADHNDELLADPAAAAAFAAFLGAHSPE